MSSLRRGVLSGASGALLLFGMVLGVPKVVSADTTVTLGHAIHQTWGSGYPYPSQAGAGRNGYWPYGGYPYQYPGSGNLTTPSGSPTVPTSGPSDSAAGAATTLAVCEAFFMVQDPSQCEHRAYRNYYLR